MENKYNEKEAAAYIERYPEQPPELALRVYTSRLIGREEDLVLHGGGNTSVKCQVEDILGEARPVIFVKGSGWDLGEIEPEGHPGLELAWLRKLRALDSLSDEEMVNQFRTHLLDSSSPNPSIETLVHTFLPHTFIDHTHADAIVTLTNIDNCQQIIQEALGPKVGILPFIMPGFPLALAVIDLYEKNPDMECLILRNHGIFTFGDDARTSYERMIHYVSLAEEYIDRANSKYQPLFVSPKEQVDPAGLMPLLRGQYGSQGPDIFFQLHLRQNEEVLAALAREDARQLFSSGVLTPDHVIRTKNYPLFLDLAGVGEDDLPGFIADEFKTYGQRYGQYFADQVAARNLELVKLDPLPRVILVPGLGVITAGGSPGAASAVADIAEHTIRTKVRGLAIAPYAELRESFIFDMEYWSLEQAKLGGRPAKALAGRVALVTGGGGAIACGIGRQLLAAGARVFLTDIDETRLDQVRQQLVDEFNEDMVSSLVMDVCDPDSVRLGLDSLVVQAGGLDILVPNAGVAHVARLEDLADESMRKVIDVNLMGVFQVIKAAIPIFRAQGFGGQIIINSSKNVFAPGAAFGAYSASKAGAHQLGKVAAMELAEIDVRVNMINPDAIFNDQDVSSGLWDVIGPDRMKSRNLDPAGLKEYYRQRNLLKAEVLADHVGHGVVFFASGLTPTTGATLPVDGGVAAAFPR